jgi:DNA-binding SARP family transcriptional activator/ribosomal protein S15P/S13E
LADPEEVIGARLRTPRLRALARQRVDALLDRVWDHPITLVVAPAGSGKTTALSLFAGRATDPVAWYRADGADGSVGHLLAHLEAAFVGALTGLTTGWDTVGAAAAALERWPGRRAALVIDDLHAIRGTPAEAVLERLIDYLPPHISVAAASRTSPSFDLTRLRLTGNLLEVGADDLRFRTWETEQLFRELYDTLLPPEDLARLTRRVEGWAAGLQLYHLAARSKPPAEQRRLIDVVSSRSRLAREYLTRNVLDTLSEELRSFLIDTCVLGVVTPSLANGFLGRQDSARLLGELEALQLFTIPLDDEGTYRYHEVLRSHLEVLLSERDGDEAVRERHLDAGRQLARAGFVAEALRCYGRSGDWDAVSALLGEDEDGRLSDAHRWLDTMPASIVDHDPWLLLARARASTSAGRLRDAVSAYQEAERLFGDTPPAERCQRERLDLQSWLDPLAQPAGGWAGLLRAGLRRDPLGAAAQLAELDEPGPLVAGGLLALVATDLTTAVLLLERAVIHVDAGPRTVATARLALAVAAVLGQTQPVADLVDSVEASAEQLGYGLLARLARATFALTDRADMIGEAATVTRMSDADGDPWGGAIAKLFEGLGALAAGRASPDALEDAVARCRALGAPALESLALGALALAMARAEHPDALTTALSAEHLARQVGSLGACAMALTAQAELDPAARDEHLAGAAELALEGGFHLPAIHLERPAVAPPLRAVPAPEPVAPAPPAIAVQCFGLFAVHVDGAGIDLSVLRPRARSTLRLLALHAGRPVHKEVLAEALWQGNEPDSALRNLQVAVSSIRQVLAASSATAGALLAREGEAYRLAVGDDDCDLRRFEVAIRSATTAHASGNDEAAAEAAEAALDLHRGDLLAEEGPAEWVVGERDKCKVDAANVAALLGEIELDRGRPGAAAAACDRGLRIDRYHDGLWRLLATAYEASGDRAAAARARLAYQDVMRELGVAG